MDHRQAFCTSEAHRQGLRVRLVLLVALLLAPLLAGCGPPRPPSEINTEIDAKVGELLPGYGGTYDENQQRWQFDFTGISLVGEIPDRILALRDEWNRLDRDMHDLHTELEEADEYERRHDREYSEDDDTVEAADVGEAAVDAATNTAVEDGHMH